VQIPLEERLGPVLQPAPADRTYEVFALRYGTCRTTHAHRTGGPPGQSEIQMDFYLWVIRGPEQTIVVDTGFDPAVGRRRRRTCLADPIALLRLLGVDPETVGQLVLTHLHYDHIGNVNAFPRAAIHLHRRELEFWQGDEARRPEAAALNEPGELRVIESALDAGRINLIDADAEIAPGVLAIPAPGHTPGQLIVAVRCDPSIVVLASDALHFYGELDGQLRFALFTDAEQTEAAYALLRRITETGAIVVPGHDPEVLDRFPRLPEALGEFAVRLG